MDNFTFTAELQKLRAGENPPKKRNGYWTEEDKKKLVKMFKDAVGISQIAIRLERTEVAVMSQLVMMGLFSPQCQSRAPKKLSIKKKKCQCPECECNSCPNCGKDGQKVSS